MAQCEARSHPAVGVGPLMKERARRAAVRSEPASGGQRANEERASTEKRADENPKPWGCGPAALRTGEAPHREGVDP